MVHFADLKLKEWDKAIKDCTTVMELEPNNIKGKYEYEVIDSIHNF